jgi:hypothetical protein
MSTSPLNVTPQHRNIVVSEVAMVNAQLYMFALAPMLTHSAFSSRRCAYYEDCDREEDDDGGIPRR